MSCGPDCELGLDGGVLVVAQPVAVDDRLHQLGAAAEVVVERRGVALARELVDVAQRHVEPLAGEEVQRGAQQLVPRRLGERLGRRLGVDLGHRCLI